MDMHGRLHIDGFVGETFEETGITKEVKLKEHQKYQGNRAARRAAAKLDALAYRRIKTRVGMK